MDEFQRAQNRCADRIHQRLQSAARAFHATSGFRILSEPNDLAQEAMVKVTRFITARQEILGDAFVLDSASETEALRWGMTCLKNAFIDEIRSVRIRQPSATRNTSRDGEEDPPDAPSTEPSAEENAIASSLLRALGSLDTRNRDRVVEGLRHMLGSVGDRDFTRATLSNLTGLSHTQLARVATEVIRKGIDDGSSVRGVTNEI